MQLLQQGAQTPLFKNVPFSHILKTQLEPTVFGASEYFEQSVTHYC